MGQWLQRLLTGAKADTVSAATIQGYLRAASQIEEVWQQIDEKVDELIVQGLPPWEAYVRLGYALAFVRACRMNVLFVQELLKADAAANPAGTGTLPRITYDQALALCEQIEPYIEEALKAATQPHYVLAEYRLPLALGPHLRDASQRIPRPHLQGLIGAAQEMREWSAGLLAKYELALHAAKIAPPPQVTTHLEKMKSELELGNFHLRAGIDMVGQLSLGQSTDELNAKSEGLLWEAMGGFYTVSQLIALSAMPARPARQVPPTTQPAQPVTELQKPEIEPPQPRPMPPIPPAPDTTQLFNQVIAGPGPGQHSPAPPVEDGSKLLNQVIAGAEHAPVQPTSDVTALLNQVITSSEPKQQPVVDTSDLLKQVTDGPAVGQRGTAQSASQKKSAPEHQSTAPKQRTEDITEGLLSDICGEPKEPHR